MKDIPLAFKIIGLVVIVLVGAIIAYVLVATPKTPIDGPTAFVDPFPTPFAPRPEVLYPKAVLSADSTIVPYNGQAVLSWSSVNSTSCLALDGWEGKQATSGTFSTGPLTSARTYDLKCTGENGESLVESLTVNVIPLPTGRLDASPNPIPYNGNTMLTWSSSNETESCVASGGWSGEKKIAGNQKESGLLSTKTYLLKCTGRGGSVTSSVTVSVIPLPSGSLTAEPNPVPYKGTTTLAWSSSDATVCDASGSWRGRKATTGTESTGPLVSSKTYVLKCTGRGGVTTKSVTVRVLGVPKGTLVAEPNIVPYNGNATLTWSATGNAASCTASGAWNGMKTAEGSEVVGPLTATQKYILTCTGPGGDSVPQTVTIRVEAQVLAGSPSVKPTMEFSAESISIPYGTSPTLVWSSEGTSSCTASGGWTGMKESSGSETPAPTTRATTYSLNCRGAGGSVSKSVSVSVVALPTAGALRASPNQVPDGETTNITWTAGKGATSCTASGGENLTKPWSGTKEISGTMIVGPFTTTQALVLTCSGAGGESKPQSVTIKVLPKGDFYAEATEIVSGTQPKLVWNIENATQCTAGGGWSGAKPVSGTSTVAAITRPANTYKTYTLSCTGPGGTKSVTPVTVKLLALPTGTLIAKGVNGTTDVSSGSGSNPSIVVDYNNSATLFWNPSADTTSCTASGGWSGVVYDINKPELSKQQTISGLQKTANYILTCTGPGGLVEKSVTVKVKPGILSFTANHDKSTYVADENKLNPCSSSDGDCFQIGLNGTPKIEWTVYNADSCSATGWNDNQNITSFVVTGQTLSPINKDTPYTLTCTNAAGSVEKKITVKIKDPTVTLTSASPDVSYAGAETTLVWSSKDVISCTGSGGGGDWDGVKFSSGGVYYTGSLTSSHTYKLVCLGGNNRTVSKSVTVTIRTPITLYFRCSYAKNANLAEVYEGQYCEWARSGYPGWPGAGSGYCAHAGNPTVPSLPLMRAILKRVGLSTLQTEKIERVELVSSSAVNYCDDGGVDGTQGIFKVY
ncbi:MAG: hypothetical protein AAB552_02200 [Patescibacteria group bacterium]